MRGSYGQKVIKSDILEMFQIVPFDKLIQLDNKHSFGILHVSEIGFIVEKLAKWLT